MKKSFQIALIFLLTQTFSNSANANNPQLEYHKSGAITGNNFHSIYFGVRAPENQKKAMTQTYCYGFSWYSTAWPLIAEHVDGLQIGLTQTWITPNVEKHQPMFTDSGKRVRALQYKNGTAEDRAIIQTMEGGMGWWRGTVHRDPMPKVHTGGNANNYHSFVKEFRQNDPTKQGDGGWIAISNQILNPPDGMTLDPVSNGRQLGRAWLILPFPETGSQSGIPAGNNAWTLFFNSENFKGPIAYIAPQFWADKARPYAFARKLTLDNNCGSSVALAQEWATIPYYTSVDADGNRFSKIPQLQFTSDEKGRTIFARDYSGYGIDAIYKPFAQSLNTKTLLPKNINNSDVKRFNLVRKKNDKGPAHQDRKDLPDLQVLRDLKIFDDGKAYGLAWDKPNSMIQLPTYFKENGEVRNAISKDQAPQDLQNSSFVRTKNNFVYQTPQWFIGVNPASGNFVTHLNDGSKVTYTWYKFCEQPMLRRFNLTEEEKARLQEVVIKMQKEWAHNPLMPEPSAGSLVKFDQGLFVTPPAGLEFGYVPIIISQE